MRNIARVNLQKVKEMFWRVLKWIINSKIAQLVALVLASLAAFKGVQLKARHDGKKQERESQERKDAENAKDIRRRVDAVKPSGLRPDDRRGYRDE